MIGEGIADIYQKMPQKQSALFQLVNMKKAFADAQRQAQIEALRDHRKSVYDTGEKLLSNEAISPAQYNQYIQDGKIPLSNETGSGMASAYSNGNTESSQSSAMASQSPAEVDNTKASPSNYMGSNYIGPKKAAKNLALKEKQDQFYQGEWSKFIKQNTPDTASSRSTFGIASRSNLQAGRVIQTLQNNPNVTYQDLGNVVADLAGIYQGGAPTDQGMKHQQYESLQTLVANIKQYSTGKPQDAVPQGFKDKIMDVANKTISLNTNVLKKHFDAQEAAQSTLISKFPDQWKAFREQSSQDYMDGLMSQTKSNQTSQQNKVGKYTFQ